MRGFYGFIDVRTICRYPQVYFRLAAPPGGDVQSEIDPTWKVGGPIVDAPRKIKTKPTD